MPEQGHIRVHGQGEVEVELIVAYLADLRHTYNSILVFESAMDGFRRAYREFGYPFYIGSPAFPFPRRGIRPTRDWPPAPDEIASLIPHSEQLVLAGVRLQSPGFWDFVGKLNPLEVIRQYLNDRHERRKDREYRESAEARKLKLENLKLENEVIASRIQLAKDLGATERDLAPLLNELVFRPLAGLDRHQDKGVIETAEVPRLPGQG
jgi:hypothetical protein